MKIVGHQNEQLNSAGGRVNAEGLAAIVATDYRHQTGESMSASMTAFVQTLGLGSK